MSDTSQSNPATEYSAESISRHFDEFGLSEWHRLVETPVDEIGLYLHTWYLHHHVPAGARVLEIGAGAGRFTQVLAVLGAHILVADISPVQLELNQRFAHELGFFQAVESWQLADICNLGSFDAAAFDCVVAYGGPFSYVLDRRDEALKECLRVLKPDGTILLSVMSLWGTAHRNLDGVLELPSEINQKITGSGDLTPATFPARRGNFMHLFRAAGLREWLSGYPLAILALSASGCLSTGWGELLQRIRGDEAKWQELLRMELEASAAEGALDMGTHLIAVARKEGEE